MGRSFDKEVKRSDPEERAKEQIRKLVSLEIWNGLSVALLGKKKAYRTSVYMTQHPKKVIQEVIHTRIQPWSIMILVLGL